MYFLLKSVELNIICGNETYTINSSNKDFKSNFKKTPLKQTQMKTGYLHIPTRI